MTAYVPVIRSGRSSQQIKIQNVARFAHNGRQFRPRCQVRRVSGLRRLRVILLSSALALQLWIRSRVWLPVSVADFFRPIAIPPFERHWRPDGRCDHARIVAGASFEQSTTACRGFRQRLPFSRAPVGPELAQVSGETLN